MLDRLFGRKVEMITEELKPCPFCGSLRVSFSPGEKLFMVVCRQCLGSGPAVDVDREVLVNKDRYSTHKAQAIVAWNNRECETAQEADK